MPLSGDAASGVSRAHSRLLTKQSTPNSYSSQAVFHLTQRSAIIPVLRLSKRQQKKTCCCRSAYPPPVTRDWSRHKDNERDFLSSDNLAQEISPARHDRSSSERSFSSMVLSPPFSPPKSYLELPVSQYMLLLLGSVSFAACGAFIALVATAIPTLNAMRKAALALERLAETAREELPGTMAAVRLSGMEISDLTLELSDLSQDISDSVRSSAQAVRAAEVGIRRLGAMAASQTLSILQEHASVPVQAVKPVVATAAETTMQAVSQAHKAVLGLAAMPVLSNWIQKKKLEEQKEIAEAMSLDSLNEIDKQGDSDLLSSTAL